MPVNSDKPHLWKADIRASVDFYNDWFIRFAPKAYRDTRKDATTQVEKALQETSNLLDIRTETLVKCPYVLPILRMSTAPPIARDRLIGLADVSGNLVKSMELQHRIPPKMLGTELHAQLKKMADVIATLLDEEIFPWVSQSATPNASEIHRAATIIADRLCGAIADPIVRNAQEQRQLAILKKWLEAQGYQQAKIRAGMVFSDLKPGEFSFRLNVAVKLAGNKLKKVNIPIDAVIQPLKSKKGEIPLFIEAKSAGDFTNTNKRRKEEAAKMSQLRSNYGTRVRFVLFLCGYFDSGYLGYEAAEGIDWVWEHRVKDLNQMGV